MSQRTLSIALIVSLVVNVFVIGAIVGAFGMRMRVEEQRRQPPRAAIMRMSEQLPEDVRNRYMAAMRAQGQANRPKMELVRQARADAMRAFAAEPFDAKAASDALARARTAETETRAALETTIVEFAKGLAPEERRIIGQSLRGGPRGMGGGRRGPGPGGRDGRPPFEGPGAGFGPPPEGLPPAEK